MSDRWWLVCADDEATVQACGPLFDYADVEAELAWVDQHQDEPGVCDRHHLPTRQAPKPGMEVRIVRPAIYDAQGREADNRRWNDEVYSDGGYHDLQWSEAAS